MDESNEDPRLPHHQNPINYVSTETLIGLYILSLPIFWELCISANCVIMEFDFIAEIGVLYWKLNAKNYENDPELEKIREERGYNYFVSFLYLFTNALS